ncbi:MAG: N-acetyltransferase [Planctomycetota bacterium]
MTDIAIREVRSRADLKKFRRLPFAIYRDDPLWVPPLNFDVKNRLNRAKNPFFEHSEAIYFLAERAGRTVGRIAAILNRRHQEFHEDRVGFFGWFECENDAEVALSLFTAAESWLRERGCDTLRGPASFSLNDECGLLIEGFHRPATMLTPWNPPYYADLLESCGFSKAMDLNSYYMPVMDFPLERTERIIRLIKKREGATVRKFDPSRYDEEVARVLNIYNEAWTKNWGFVPMTESELKHMAKDMKPVIDPRLASFVEIEGRAVGFALVLPDINCILKKLGGRLFPFGIFRLLFGLKRVPGVRLLAMGVSEEFHKRGIDALLYQSSFEGSVEGGRVWSELGWVLENNTVMHNALIKLNANLDRVHRLYDRAIS